MSADEKLVERLYAFASDPLTLKTPGLQGILLESIAALRALPQHAGGTAGNFGGFLQTGYIHVGCGACWQVHFNDAGFYAKCLGCNETRPIDPTFPKLRVASAQGAVSVPSKPTREWAECYLSALGSKRSDENFAIALRELDAMLAAAASLTRPEGKP